MTRLAPARSCGPEGLAACVPFFAPAGLALGAVCTLAAKLALTALPVPAAAPSAGASPLALGLVALLWLGLEIWLTRGLHWDGLADLADAAGSPAPRFWEILRDSRLGVFGGLALLVAFCGQWTSLAWHVGAGHWPHLILAPAWGRACAVWLAASATPCRAHSLGGLVKAGASFRLALLYALAALAVIAVFCACGLSWRQGLLLTLAQLWLTRYLVRLSQSKGGYSGDFLGAAIVAGQTLFLLATL